MITALNDIRKARYSGTPKGLRIEIEINVSPRRWNKKLCKVLSGALDKPIDQIILHLPKKEKRK